MLSEWMNKFLFHWTKTNSSVPSMPHVVILWYLQSSKATPKIPSVSKGGIKPIYFLRAQGKFSFQLSHSNLGAQWRFCHLIPQDHPSTTNKADLRIKKRNDAWCLSEGIWTPGYIWICALLSMATNLICHKLRPVCVYVSEMVVFQLYCLSATERIVLCVCVCARICVCRGRDRVGRNLISLPLRAHVPNQIICLFGERKRKLFFFVQSGFCWAD